MKTPLVTIGISFFNSEATIAYAIESVLNQEWKDFELLLINDGSTDGGLEAVRPFLDDKRVRLLNDGRNVGLAPRLNEITRVAAGRYIARMDADDIMHPSRLLRQVEYLGSHPAVDLLGTGAYFIDSDFTIIERRITHHIRLCKKFSYLQLLHPTIMGRVEWFRANPYSSQFLRCEDTELWLRAGGGANIHCIDDPLLYYSRFTTSDVTKTVYSLRQYREILRLHSCRTCLGCRLREDTIARLKEIGYRTTAKAGLTKRIVKLISRRSKLPVPDNAEWELRSIRDRVAKRKSQKMGDLAEHHADSPFRVPVGIEVNGDPGLSYPDGTDAFSPDEHYPEYPFTHLSSKPNPVYRMVRDLFRDMDLDSPRYGSAGWNPLGKWVEPGQTVFVLVNFVTQRRPMQNPENFEAMLTHPSVIRAVIDYLIIATGDAKLVRFGNAPVQSVQMEVLAEQIGAARLRDFYQREVGLNLGPCDLRLYVSTVSGLGAKRSAQEFDRRDEIAFELGCSSLLDRLPTKAFPTFRVEDYGSDSTCAYHRKGSHIYNLHRAVISSDVIFHVAKLKTHGKVGLTGGLKGAVGAITRKDCLAHHRHGSAEQGNDEFKRSTILTRFYAALGNKVTADCSNWTRILFKTTGRILDRVFRIDIRGSWYGNDTAWRMALDINKCLIYGRLDGTFSRTRMRKICCLLDGIVSGEGDGPINVRNRRDGVLLFSGDPSFADLGAALVMGFDPERIPLLREAFQASDLPIASASPAAAEFLVNGISTSTNDIPGKIVPGFRPPRGWIGHIEQRGNKDASYIRTELESLRTISGSD